MKNNIDNKNVVPHRALHLTTIDMPHLCLRTAFGKELLSYHFRETWVPHNAGSKIFMIQNANNLKLIWKRFVSFQWTVSQEYEHLNLSQDLVLVSCSFSDHGLAPGWKFCLQCVPSISWLFSNYFNLSRNAWDARVQEGRRQRVWRIQEGVHVCGHCGCLGRIASVEEIKHLIGD